MTRKSLLTIAISVFVVFALCWIMPPKIMQLDEFLAMPPITGMKFGLVLGLIYGIPIPFVAIAGRHGVILTKGNTLYETCFAIFVGLCIGLAMAMFFLAGTSFILAFAFAAWSVAVLYGYYRFASWIFKGSCWSSTS